jgi:hypothetical protein
MSEHIQRKNGSRESTMKDIPVTVRGRSYAARAFVGNDLVPNSVKPIDLRPVCRFEQASSARTGIDFLPGEYVERWLV